jgi:hypothetical protein
VLGGGFGEGLLEGADEVCIGGFEGMLLGDRGSLVILSAFLVAHISCEAAWAYL